MPNKYDSLPVDDKNALQDVLKNAKSHKDKELNADELPKIVKHLVSMRRRGKSEQVKCSALLRAKETRDLNPTTEMPSAAEMLAARDVKELLDSALAKEFFPKGGDGVTAIADASMLEPLTAFYAPKINECVDKKR